MRLAFMGMNNIHDASSLKEDELSMALNVNISNRGVARRREGITSLSSSVFHSLFSDGVTLYGVNSSIIHLDLDTSRPYHVKTVADNSDVSFTVASNGWVFYTNGDELGYFDSGTPLTLPAVEESYYDEAGVLVTTGKVALPASDYVEFFEGSLFLLQHNNDETWLIWTDPWDFDGYMPSASYLRWKGSPRMLKAVDDGLFVGVGDYICFVSFADGSPTEKSVATFAAVPGSAVLCEATKTALKDILQGKCLIMATAQGFYVGGNGGQFINVSADKVAIMIATKGAATLMERDGQVYYLCNLQGAGDHHNERDITPIILDTI